MRNARPNPNQDFTDLGELLFARGYIGRHGGVVESVAANNLLGEPNFRVVTFEDGFKAAFCKGAYNQWFRNEQCAEQKKFARKARGL